VETGRCFSQGGREGGGYEREGGLVGSEGEVGMVCVVGGGIVPAVWKGKRTGVEREENGGGRGRERG
jgi:hypothetical protein